MPKSLPDAVQRQLEEAEAFDKAPVDPNAAAPPTDPPAPPEPPPVVEAPVDWEQRFKTLQGKYNTEVPQLHQQVKDLTKKVDDLTAAKPAPAPAPPPAPTLVTSKDNDDFGADLIDLIRRASREEYGPEKAKLEAEIAELKAKLPDLQTGMEKVAETQTATSRAAYFVDLAEKVPDYEAVNADTQFLEWLQQADPISGVNRNVLLQDAFATFDVKRTATIFNVFKQETGRVAPPVSDPAPPEPKNELEREVSPGNSRSPSTTPITTEGRTWTDAEIGEFYAAVTRGDYRGNQEEARRIDAEIDKALTEGRVKG